MATQENITTSAEQTEALAATIGRRLRGGEVLVLISDLGGGKTAFVRGLASGIGSQDVVSSPSFTLSNEYHGDRLTLHHYDFYRLSEPGIMRQELAEVIADTETVVAVEWAGVVEDVLPADHLTVTITVRGEAERQMVFSYPDSLSYLLEDDT